MTSHIVIVNQAISYDVKTTIYRKYSSWTFGLNLDTSIKLPLSCPQTHGAASLLQALAVSLSFWSMTASFEDTMGRCLTEDVWTIRTFSMTDGFIQNISLSLKRYGYLTLSWKRKSAFTVQDRSAKGSCHHYHLLLILLACVIAAYLGNEAFEKKTKHC